MYFVNIPRRFVLEDFPRSGGGMLSKSSLCPICRGVVVSPARANRGKTMAMAKTSFEMPVTALPLIVAIFFFRRLRASPRSVGRRGGGLSGGGLARATFDLARP